MKIFEILVLIITVSNVISDAIENHSSNIEDLPNIPLNQGEYFPVQHELKLYNPQFGYNLRGSQQYPIQSHGSELMLIKRTQEVPSAKKIVLAYPSTQQYPPSLPYAGIHHTKVIPAKVIQEGPVKHVYLPELYNGQSGQINTLRTPKTFIGYQPGQYQQNFIKPALRYTSVNYGSDQGIHFNGLYFSTNGYRIPSPKLNTGYASQYYSAGSQYAPQSIISPGYSPLAILPQQNVYTSQQFPHFVNNGYLHGMPNQYNPTSTQSQEFVTTIGNPKLNDIGRQAKISNLDPELTNIVNDVLNKGQGQSTHDGFTMIKSKTDNAIYLIGKPGMSLSTIPNFSAYNYDSFKKTDEPSSTKKEQKENTSA